MAAMALFAHLVLNNDFEPKKRSSVTDAAIGNSYFIFDLMSSLTKSIRIWYTFF